MRPSSLSHPRAQDVQSELPFPLNSKISADGRLNHSERDPAVERSESTRSSPHDSERKPPHSPQQRSRNKKPPVKAMLLPEGRSLVIDEEPLEDVSFLRLPEVKAITGLSKTSIYELIREKSFPAPVRLGPRAVAWVKSEIRQWALERVHASRSAA